MSVSYNPKIVTSGLALALDAGNTKSYPGSGTTWTDLSGNGRTGTLTNGPTYSSTNGGSIVFDGTNDYVSCSLNKTTLGTAFTISLWFSCSGAQSNVGIFQIADSLSSIFPWILLQRNSPNVRWYLNGDYRITNSLLDSTYVNLVITFQSDVWTVYKNGISDGTYSGVIGTYTGTTTWLGNGYNGYFNGNIPITQAYNRVLSAQEIRQNFNTLRGRFGI